MQIAEGNMIGSGNGDLGFGISVGLQNNYSAPAKQIMQDTQGLNRAFSQLGQSVGASTNNINNITKRLETTVAASQARITTGISLIGAAVGTMIPIGMGIKFAGELEQAEIGFATLMGSTVAAKQEISNIQKLAAATPFEFPGILAADRALLSATGNADQARKIFMALGNVTSAFGQGEDVLVRMAQNMQGIKSSMKATSMDIKQFTNVGIPLWDLMAETTGKSVKQLKDMDITFEMISGALLKAGGEGGRYGKAMETMSQSIVGKFSTLSDEFKNAFAEVGKAIMPILHPVIDALTGLLRMMGKFAGTKFGRVIVFATVAMAGLLLVTGLYLAISGVMQGSLAKLALQFKAMGLAEIFTTFATGGLTAGMAALGAAIWAALAPLLPFIAAAAAVVLVGKLLLDNLGKQGSAWEKLKTITGGVIEIFQTWNGTTSEISKETKENLEKMGLLGFFQKLSTWVVRGIEFFKAYFKPFIDLGEDIFALFGPLGNLFKAIGNALSALAGSFGASTGSVKGFSQAGSALGNILHYPIRILQFMVNVLGFFINVVAYVINKIASLITWYKGWTQGLKESGSWLYYVVKALQYMILPFTLVAEHVGKLIDLFAQLSEYLGITSMLQDMGIIEAEATVQANSEGSSTPATEGEKKPKTVSEAMAQSQRAKGKARQQDLQNAISSSQGQKEGDVITNVIVEGEVIQKITNKRNQLAKNRG